MSYETMIRKISDIHGQIEREMKSSSLQLFSGSNRAVVDSAGSELAEIRTRLSQIQQSLTDPLWVVLLGRFSSGKSSLINAFFECSGGSQMRDTGRAPTDRQVTVVLHELSNTGLIISNSSSVEVDGLTLSIQRHNVDRLKPLLIVDTPGLLDEGKVDKALMEFVQHADVVLHCMTPDAQLIEADRKLLEKRQTHFPSQIYHIVNTKADTVYRDRNGDFLQHEWDKDLAILSSRYSSYMKHNLDLRPNARTNKVWIIDSISGFNVETLLLDLLEFAEDCVDNVPRIRAPIIRDRLNYVCIGTIDDVTTPVIDVTEQLYLDISDAQDKLQSALQVYEKNVLSPTTELLQLTVQTLQSFITSANLEDQVAAALGIASLLEPENQSEAFSGLVRLLSTSFLLGPFEQWRQKLNSSTEIKSINELHSYHQKNFEMSRENMKRNAIPVYADWFKTSSSGRKWSSFLKLSSIEQLLPEIEMNAPVHDADGSATDGEDTGDRTIINPDEIEENLIKYFTQGTQMVLESADADSDKALVFSLRSRVMDSLFKTHQKYSDRATTLNSEEENQIEEHVQTIVNNVNRAVTVRIHQVVETMRQSFDGNVGRIRGELLERGISTHLQLESDTVWEDGRKSLDRLITEVVKEELKSPLNSELQRLRTMIQDELIALSAKLEAYEETISEWIAPDVAILRSSERNLIDTAKERTQGFIAPLEVFDAIKSTDNYFKQHDIGVEFKRDMDSHLENIYTTWANKKRGIQIRLIGSAMLSLALIVALIIPTAITNAMSIEILFVFLGTAVATFLGTFWQFLSFGKQAQDELARTVQEQLDRVSNRAITHLTDIESEELGAFTAVRIAFNQLTEFFAYNGVHTLFQQLDAQVRDGLDKFSNQVSSDQVQSIRRIRANLQSFRSTGQRLLSQTAESCGEVLGDNALMIMSENTRIVSEKLENLKKEVNYTGARLEEAKAELTKIIHTA